MSDETMMTISGRFETRDAAELVIQRLSQEHGIDRADIFVRAATDANSAGTRASGADASEQDGEGSAYRPALDGAIEVSADIDRSELAAAEETFRAAGAVEVSCH
jgi:hypothetical protein